MGRKTRRWMIALALALGVAGLEILIAVLQDREVWLEAVVLSFVLVVIMSVLVMNVIDQTRRED